MRSCSRPRKTRRHVAAAARERFVGPVRDRLRRNGARARRPGRIAARVARTRSGAAKGRTDGAYRRRKFLSRDRQRRVRAWRLIPLAGRDLTRGWRTRRTLPRAARTGVRAGASPGSIRRLSSTCRRLSRQARLRGAGPSRRSTGSDRFRPYRGGARRGGARLVPRETERGGRFRAGFLHTFRRWPGDCIGGRFPRTRGESRLVGGGAGGADGPAVPHRVGDSAGRAAAARRGALSARFGR